MAKAHQFTAAGYYVGEIEDHGLLPNNATYSAPIKKEGYIPRWNGQKWEQVENHKGKEGYICEERHTIKEYGPLPEGFSETPPPPTLEEVKDSARNALRAKRKEVEYSGFYVNGQKWDSEEKDELRLNSVTKVFETGIPAYEGWKISEGVYITLTPGLLSQAALALMQHYGNAFAVEAAKLEEINALETVEAVEAWQKTVLNQGWESTALKP